MDLHKFQAWFANDYGEQFVKLILEFAAWLTGEEGAPGEVSLVLLAALLLLIIWHGFSAWRFCRAVDDCRSILRDADGGITGDNVLDIDKRFFGSQA